MKQVAATTVTSVIVVTHVIPHYDGVSKVPSVLGVVPELHAAEVRAADLLGQRRVEDAVGAVALREAHRAAEDAAKLDVFAKCDGPAPSKSHDQSAILHDVRQPSC